MNRFLALAQIGVGILGATASSSVFAAEQPASVTATEGNAVVKDWVSPVYPAELKSSNVQGSETVNFIVNTDGSTRDPVIVEADDHRFDESIMAAIAASKFTPALSEGREIAQCVQLVWKYSLPYRPNSFVEIKPLPKQPAKLLTDVSADFPPSMLGRHINGDVRCILDINADGRVSNVIVSYANDGDFVPAAVAAFHEAHFQAALQGTLSVPEQREVSMPFVYDGNVDDGGQTVWQVNGISVVPSTGGSPAPKAPVIVSLRVPVYPMDELLAGHEGDAEATFTLNEQGVPESVNLVSASQPDFGKALVAATEASTFVGATLDGHATKITLRRTYHFALPPETEGVNESGEIRAERELRAGKTISPAKGLDHPLRPIWRLAPTEPIVFVGKTSPKGKADLQVIIDEEGRVRAPKILSAPNDECGYAAATAVSQWCFDPPTRNGVATAVRVVIPIVFK